MASLRVEILEADKIIKTYVFDLSGTTRSAMWDAFLTYWDRYHGNQQTFTWRTAELAGAPQPVV